MKILRECLRRGLSFLFIANIDKYIEKYHKQPKEITDVEHKERPMFAEYYDASASILIYFFYFVLFIAVLCTILACTVCPIKTQEDRDMQLAVFVCCFLIIIGIAVIKLMQLYYRNKVTYYCKDRIIIRSYGRKDKVISYEDIAERAKKKKVRIRKGGIELPYKGGKLHIRIHEYLFHDYTIRLLNKKCGLKIPYLTDKDVKLIRKSGILPTFAGISFSGWAVDLAFMMIGSVIERSTKTFWEVYFPDTLEMFLRTHIMFWIFGAPILIVGLIAELLNFIPLRVHFFGHKIFKV